MRKTTYAYIRRRDTISAWQFVIPTKDGGTTFQYNHRVEIAKGLIGLETTIYQGLKVLESLSFQVRQFGYFNRHWHVTED